MPIAAIELSDGRIVELEVGEGVTEQQVQDYVAANLDSFLSKQSDQQSPEDKIFEGLAPDVIERIRSETSRKQDARGRPLPAPKLDQRRARQAADFERLRIQNPYQASLIEEMNPLESFAVGAGKGLTDLGRAVGLAESSPEQRARDASMLNNRTSAAFGEIVGQSAPFAATAGVGAPAIAGLAGRAAFTGSIGALEGGLIAKGTGGTGEDILKGTLTGALLGAGSEVLLPALRGVSKSLVAKATGRPPSGTLIDDAGRPTPELNKVLEREGVSLDELIKTADEVGPEELAKRISQAGQDNRITDIINDVKADAGRIEAAQILGIDPENIPAGVLSTQQAVNEITGALSAVPGSEASVALSRFREGLAKQADDILEGNPAISDELLFDLQNNIARQSAVESKFYDAVRSAVPEEATLSESAIQAARNAQAAGRRKYKSTKLTGIDKRYSDLLKNDEITYADLDDFRKAIGAGYKKQGLFKDAETAKLDNIYGKVSNLQKRMAEDLGVGEELAAAQKASADRFGLQRTIEVMFGKDASKDIIPLVERTAKKASTGSPRALRAVLERAPEEWRGKIVEAALNKAFVKQSGEARIISSGDFANWFGALKRNPESYKEITKYLPEDTVRRLNALGTLNQGLSDVLKGKIATGIQERTFKNFDNVNGITAKLYNLSQRAGQVPGGGVVATPLTTAANIGKIFTKEKTPAFEAADGLLESKEFKRAFLSAASAGTDSRRYKQAAAKLRRSPQYRSYLRAQDQGRAAAIGSVGLIPFLLQKESEE